MSYEDLEEARAKRAVKESTQAAKGKGKRGRKRKSGTPEADEGRKRKSAAQDPPEPSNRVARAPVTASAVQMSGTPIAEDEIVPVQRAGGRTPEPHRPVP